MLELITGLRLLILSSGLCVVCYTTFVWSLAHIINPKGAEGSLVYSTDGKIIGSELIGQQFVSDKYFWPRPSAVKYDSSASGASNRSPLSQALTKRAQESIKAFIAAEANLLPAELVAASGSGLDPHITQRAAKYQVTRIAKSSGIDETELISLVQKVSNSSKDGLVNVLLLNLELDVLKKIK